MTRIVQPPRTLGHEIAGTVVAVGPDAQRCEDRRRVGWCFPGSAAAPARFAPPATNTCATRRASLGVNRDGGFADHVVVPHPNTCSTSAVARRPSLHLRLLGPHRLQRAEEGRAAGSRSDAAADHRRRRRRPVRHSPARKLYRHGADRGCRARREQMGRRARSRRRRSASTPTPTARCRRLLKSTGGGVAAAIDFVGAGRHLRVRLRRAAQGRQAGLRGPVRRLHSVVPAMVSMKAVSVIGSYVGSLAEMHELMAIARSGSLPALPMSVDAPGERHAGPRRSAAGASKAAPSCGPNRVKLIHQHQRTILEPAGST